MVPAPGSSPGPPRKESVWFVAAPRQRELRLPSRRLEGFGRARGCLREVGSPAQAGAEAPALRREGVGSPSLVLSVRCKLQQYLGPNLGRSEVLMQTTPVVCINAFKCTAGSKSCSLGLGRKLTFPQNLLYCRVTPRHDTGFAGVGFLLSDYFHPVLYFG